VRVEGAVRWWFFVCCCFGCVLIKFLIVARMLLFLCSV
jgi:hypothetical protein